MPTNSENRKQLDLLGGGPKPHVEPVTPELIRAICRKPTMLAAWNFALDFSGLEKKQVYQELRIDSSHWTKMANGSASPPADERFVRYFDLVGNDFPLIWLAEARGWDWTTIRRHQSDLERENERLREELADERRWSARLAEHYRGSR